jgi:hypothetical protein
MMHREYDVSEEHVIFMYIAQIAFCLAYSSVAFLSAETSGTLRTTWRYNPDDLSGRTFQNLNLNLENLKERCSLFERLSTTTKCLWAAGSTSVEKWDWNEQRIWPSTLHSSVTDGRTSWLPIEAQVNEICRDDKRILYPSDAHPLAMQAEPTRISCHQT